MPSLQSILADAPLPGLWIVLFLSACLLTLSLRGHRSRPQEEARHRLRRDFWGYD